MIRASRLIIVSWVLLSSGSLTKKHCLLKTYYAHLSGRWNSQTLVLYSGSQSGEMEGDGVEGTLKAPPCSYFETDSTKRKDGLKICHMTNQTAR